MRPGALVLLVVMLLLAGCAQETPIAPVTSPVAATGPALGRGEWAVAACGSYHTLAVKQDGTLWTWGLNDYGQLGWDTIDGSAHATPTQVGHASDWASVSAGYGNSFAVRKDGTVWAWGNNCDIGFNLGLGADNWWFTRWSPTRIGKAHDWATVFYGYFHGLALKEDSTLWGWGGNFYGALGESDGTFVMAPAEVGRDRDWAAAAAGGDFSLAVKQDGTLWAWGVNAWGNLGLGDTANRRSPARVGSGHDWAAVSAGICYSLALKEDGTLWAWGANTFGELGLGDTVERHSPTRVGSADDWAAVCCLGHHSCGPEEGRHAVGLGRERLRPARPGRHRRPAHADTGRQRSRVGGDRAWRRRLLPHPGPQTGRHPLGLGLQPVRPARPGRHERSPQPG